MRHAGTRWSVKPVAVSIGRCASHFSLRCTTKSLSILSVTVDLRLNGDAVFVGRKEPNAYGRTADEWYVLQQRLSKFISMILFTRRSRRVGYSLFTSTTCQWDECRCSDHVLRTFQSHILTECLAMAINQRTYQL